MSIWTHVNISIRFDALRLPGMPAALSRRPDLAAKLPCGSEGPLEFQLWENPHPTHLAAYTANIWGDLRDYDDVAEIRAYLDGLTRDAMVRSGIAEIDVEGRGRMVLVFDGEWKEIVP